MGSPSRYFAAARTWRLRQNSLSEHHLYQHFRVNGRAGKKNQLRAKLLTIDNHSQ
jgi:hypothetical protein